MKLSKLAKAFKNRNQILEGIKNNIFRKDHIEAVAALRYNTCKNCPLLDMEGGNCAVPGTQPCCGECGCSLALKTRSLSSECPMGYWKAVMDEETENKLKEKIGYEDRDN